MMRMKKMFDKRDPMLLAIPAGIVLILSIAMILGMNNNTLPFTGDTENSGVNGSLSAFAYLTDPSGEKIWSSDRGGVSFSVIDPKTGKDASALYAGIDFQCSGREINWNTLSVEGQLSFEEFRGIGGGKKMTRQLESKTITSQNGTIAFAPVDIQTLMPDSVTIIFRGYDVDTGQKTVWSETYEQKTTEAHPVTFVFTGWYTAVVYDNYDHKYVAHYSQVITLNLMWSGTDFNIEWSDGSGQVEVPAPTSSVPTIDSPSDDSVPAMTAYTITWYPVDVDGDYDRYEIYINDDLQVENAWSGGQISFAHKYVAGLNDVKIVVYDLAGNMVDDTVRISAYDGIDDGLDGATHDSPDADMKFEVT